MTKEQLEKLTGLEVKEVEVREVRLEPGDPVSAVMARTEHKRNMPGWGNKKGLLIVLEESQ